MKTVGVKSVALAKEPTLPSSSTLVSHHKFSHTNIDILTRVMLSTSPPDIACMCVCACMFLPKGNVLQEKR